MDDNIINPEDLLKINPNSGKAAYIFKLLISSTLNPDIIRNIENRLIDGDIDIREYENLIMTLQETQIDKIDAGHKYSQTDIHNKLKRMGL